jgi:hypothetical protein
VKPLNRFVIAENWRQYISRAKEQIKLDNGFSRSGSNNLQQAFEFIAILSLSENISFRTRVLNTVETKFLVFLQKGKNQVWRDFQGDFRPRETSRNLISSVLNLLEELTFGSKD